MDALPQFLGVDKQRSVCREWCTLAEPLFVWYQKGETRHMRPGVKVYDCSVCALVGVRGCSNLTHCASLERTIGTESLIIFV